MDSKRFDQNCIFVKSTVYIISNKFTKLSLINILFLDHYRKKKKSIADFPLLVIYCNHDAFVNNNLVLLLYK